MSPTPPSSPLDRLTRLLALGGGHYALYPPPRDFYPVDDAQFTAAIQRSNGDPIPAQLALHFDIPAAYRSGFCSGKTALPQDCARADGYRDRLIREIGLIGACFDRDRDVVEVSLAPGMARWMRPDDVAELLECLSRHFHMRTIGGVDLAMTLDQEDLASAPLRDWAALGFNRVGIGVSAQGIERPHAIEHVTRLVERVRDAGFANLRVEVPYDLPGRSAAVDRQDRRDLDLAALIAAVVAVEPDRVGLRHCPTQETLDVSSLATYSHHAHARMLLASADALEAAGYLHVGCDVFARPSDPLVVAQHRGQLHRDALGFGTHGTTDLVGFGVGAITQLGSCYARSPTDSSTWEARIDRGHRAVDRGFELQSDDLLRAELLQHILCYGRVDTKTLEDHHRIDFDDYFAAELGRLRPLFEDGSLAREGAILRLDRIGRLASRVVARHFDPGVRPVPATPASLRAVSRPSDAIESAQRPAHDT